MPSDVIARNSRTNPADDFISDRVEVASDFLSSDRFFALGTDQYNFVAELYEIVTAVNHELIHRHHTDDWSSTTTDEYLATIESKPTRHTVGVTNRNGGNGAVGFKAMTQSIGNAFTSRDALHH